MTITNILLALALMALCVIAFELRALLKRIETLRDILRGEGDLRPAPRETPGAGQTINVNLSPLQASVPGMQPLVVPIAGTGAQRAEGTQGAASAGGTASVGKPEADDESDEAKRARERERALAEERADAQVKKADLVTATQSGLIAVKCAACGAENSAYRDVCFNCGGSL
jgi:hypothetical protein